MLRQARLPLEILAAPRRHFTTHFVQRFGIENSFGQREDFVVFHRNVVLVDGMKFAEMVEQARRFVSRKPAAREPLLAKLLDSIVARLCNLVIGFQRLNLGQRFASRAIAEFTHPREQGLFFVGGVLWRSLAEIAQCGFERFALLCIKFTALRLFRDENQRAQETFHAAMAI
jgi:hypothetical protein